MSPRSILGSLSLSLSLSLGLSPLACTSDDGGSEAADGTGSESGSETGDGDGDGDGPTPPSSCTLLPVPIARGRFEVGTNASIATPNVVGVVGEVPGSSGPWVATWAGAKTQFFESGPLTQATDWSAQFDYSQDTGWPGQCPADAPVCAKSDELSFSLLDEHYSDTTGEGLFAQASLCVDLNRSEGVCPLPVVLDSVTATPDPDDPARLAFAVTLLHPDLDCAGLDGEDGVRVTWTVADGGDGSVVEGDAVEVQFIQASVPGLYFKGEVEVVCTKTYDAGGTPTQLDLRASSEFYVDCE